MCITDDGIILAEGLFGEYGRRATKVERRPVAESEMTITP
jgi:hypothetical protein